MAIILNNGAGSPLPIFSDIFYSKISAISISIFITAALFGLLALQDVEKVTDVLHF